MTYNEFITNLINTRGQWGIPKTEYFEAHHILPKCMGGECGRNKRHKNIIWLYPQEHFIAHKLLAEENPTIYPIIIAFKLMCSTTRRSSRFKERAEIEVTPEDYALCRKLYNECPVPEEVRQKISKSNTDKPHPKPNKENYGKWRQGRHVYINIKNNSKLFIADNEQIPDGYVAVAELTKARKLKERAEKPNMKHAPRTEEQKLRVSVIMKTKKWFTDGVNEIRCKENECPTGWVLGRSVITKQRVKENHAHTSLYGERNGMYKKQHSEAARQKMSKNSSSRHWYNNGEVEVFRRSCPEGFSSGRLNHAR